MALHLEAVTERRIRNLICNIPPRVGKSLLVSVFWPVWSWLVNPSSRWLFASYAHTLSVRDSLKRRRIIESPWFQERWGDRFQLVSDQNAKHRYENDKTGFHLATSVDGSITGEGGDFLICDDPTNANDAASIAAIANTISWWDEVMSTRLNDPRTGCKVVVMQRLAPGDLTGHLLVKGGYEHLCLPMRYEADTKSRTSIGWEDWRQQEGELLWPERIGEPEVAALEKALNAFGAAGQLQQRPIPRGGFTFRREWFQIVKQAPADATWCRFWDLAATAPKAGADPDYTAGALLGLKDGQWFVKDMRRLRASPKAVEDLIRQTAQLDGPAVAVRMEQEGGSAGVNTIDHYRRAVLVGRNFDGIRSTGSKALRADPVSSAAEAKNIFLVEGEWNGEFLHEFEYFSPLCQHDDQVDAVSGAFAFLAGASKVFLD